jgi:putative transposase
VDEVREEWDVSVRQACGMLMFDTFSYDYKSRRPGQAVLEKRIKESADTRAVWLSTRALLRREDQPTTL